MISAENYRGQKVLINEITEKIIGAAIDVHRALGPGLLESAYTACLTFELAERGLTCEQQVQIPVHYKSIRLACAYRVDLIVNSSVIVEVKSLERVDAIHVAQLLTYLKLTGCPIGLLLNFKVERLIEGIRRIINSQPSALPVTSEPLW
jgi:GxxExxY protein